MKKEDKPNRVQEAKPDGEAQRWSWVKPEAWNARMLEALERGVQGNAWYTLIDKVYRLKNLEESYNKVASNGGSAGVDHVSVEKYGEDLKRELEELRQQLQTGSYTPQQIRRVYIPKAGGGERPLGIPTVRDRVVQTALLHVIEPIFEKEFLDCSYGFRPQRGCKDALRKTLELLQQGYTTVVDADIKAYFDTINQQQLIELVSGRIKDKNIIELINKFLKQGILERGITFDTDGIGTPQGGVISPLLANIYLHELDVEVSKQGYQMVRYADDFVIMCKNQEQAEKALLVVKAVMDRLNLKLHPDKTGTVDMKQRGSSFQFLGYLFKNYKGRILKYPRPKSREKFKEAVRRQTPRSNGNSMQEIIDKLNLTLRGWFVYYKHSSGYAFKDLDSWIRSRLRAILARRRKAGTRNRRGYAHFRWNNKFFAELELFCMHYSHTMLRVQSARR
jgi:RNA-directed DNA polymerase